MTSNVGLTSYASQITPIAKSAASILIILGFILQWGNSIDAFGGLT